MAFCGNCGTQVNEGVKFCPGCGNAMVAPAAEQQAQAQQPPVQEPAANQNDFSAKFANLNNTADTTAEYRRNCIRKQETRIYPLGKY